MAMVRILKGRWKISWSVAMEIEHINGPRRILSQEKEKKEQVGDTGHCTEKFVPIYLAIPPQHSTKRRWIQQWLHNANGNRTVYSLRRPKTSDFCEGEEIQSKKMC
ncbi:hypothetical protein HAX54_026014 [Datura stramonium]|uniref:Uncharacterized protein n=1 Tax=Datura stramonium TaxID=4076 RepID=A0ABS8V0P8_DATST|nr:hypothetical protein [Datura stramonium]